MLGRFPQFIDFKRYTDARKTLEGRLSFKFCHRLAAQTENPDGEITFELNFGIDEFSNRYVSGRLETQLVLVCQRCMEAFEYPISIDLALAFISSSYEEEKIQGMYESYFYEDEPQIDLHALIEDEVILAMPLIAKHNEGDCSIPTDYQLDTNQLSTNDLSSSNNSSMGNITENSVNAGQVSANGKNQSDNERRSGKSGQSSHLKNAETDAEKQNEQMERNNPFDILKQLKD